MHTWLIHVSQERKIKALSTMMSDYLETVHQVALTSLIIGLFIGTWVLMKLVDNKFKIDINKKGEGKNGKK